ncbi:MAG: SDR family oxidoreductase [Thermoproteales archaeon]|nr:SDR family oxidoreductase [Thermoproteales archaeon]
MSEIVEKDIMDIIRELKERGLDYSDEVFLITGGAGFLGSWLSELLVKLGSKVICIDNLATGKLSFIKHLLNFDNFKFIKGDVTRGVPKIDTSYDYVIHMASRASPDDYMRYPVETALANALGAYYTLELVRKNDAVYLLTSTSEVYGDAEVVPTPETYWGRVNPIGVRACYDEGKRFSEALAMSYYREYGLDVRISRIFNSYGPRLRGDGAYGRVVTRFILQALENKPLTVHGDGLQTRSFTYVKDTILAHALLLKCERCRGEVINIGNNKETTIIELAKLILELTNSKSRIVYTKPREDDPRRRKPDISKARKLLSWNPQTSLREGLKKTIEWYRRGYK